MKAEILAPAGGAQSLMAALRCGADAVYLGAKDFSARSSAENFDENALIEAAKLCRVYGAKLYLTLNTVVFDSELEKAQELIKSAAKAGVDAFIVQDLGIAAMIKKGMPLGSFARLNTDVGTYG